MIHIFSHLIFFPHHSFILTHDSFFHMIHMIHLFWHTIHIFSRAIFFPHDSFILSWDFFFKGFVFFDTWIVHILFWYMIHLFLHVTFVTPFTCFDLFPRDSFILTHTSLIYACFSTHTPPCLPEFTALHFAMHHCTRSHKITPEMHVICP